MAADDSRATPRDPPGEEPGAPLPDDYGPSLWAFLLALALIALIIILL